jgi:hypothetical protein
MRGQHGPDEIDLWCQAWAKQRRLALGILDAKLLEPRERLGQIRCTLGAVLVDKVGAGERTVRVNANGHRDQNWPEVYTGKALDVHLACSLMPGVERLTVHLHYVWYEVPANEKCKLIPSSLARYWALLSNAKFFLNGYLAMGAKRPVAAV